MDRDDDALVTDLFRLLLHEFPRGDSRSVDRYLVGAARQELADVLDRAHPAADGERHEASLGRASHHVEDDVAVLVTGGDIAKPEPAPTPRATCPPPPPPRAPPPHARNLHTPPNSAR